jgi:hypothetical protein
LLGIGVTNCLRLRLSHLSYHEAKGLRGDALLLFRMGDFYELFYEDAKDGGPSAWLDADQPGEKRQCVSCVRLTASEL